MSEKNSSSFSPKSFNLSSDQNQSQYEESLHSVNVEKEDAVIQLTNDEVEKFYVMLSFSFYNQQKKQFLNEKKAPRSLVINSALTSGLSSSMDKQRFIKGKTDSMRNQNSSRCLQNILHSNKVSDSTTESQHQLQFNSNSKNSNDTVSKKAYQQISQQQNMTKPFEFLYQNKDDRAVSVKQMNRFFYEDSSPRRDHFNDSKDSQNNYSQNLLKLNMKLSKQPKIHLLTKPSQQSKPNIQKYQNLLNQLILGQNTQKSYRDYNHNTKNSQKTPYQFMIQNTKTQPALSSHYDSSSKLLNKINVSLLKKILKKEQVRNIFSHKQSQNSPTSSSSQQFSFNSARLREPQNKLVDLLSSPYITNIEINQNKQRKSPLRSEDQYHKNALQDKQQFYLDREIINFFKKNKQLGKIKYDEEDKFNYGFGQMKKETGKLQTKLNPEVEKYLKAMKSKNK